MQNKTDVYIKVGDNGRIPEYASESAAGCDLYATEDMVIRPGETKIMPLNFIVAFQPEIEAQIRPRSGLSLKTDLRIPNGPGTIDSDYRDTVGIILQNTYNIANLPYQIAQSPEMLIEFKNSHREIELKEYLLSRESINIADFEGLDVLNQKIYVDTMGNPFGTIYISKGERIAQLVFGEFKSANFIPHPDPQKIGKNRGGGFGHTGT